MRKLIIILIVLLFVSAQAQILKGKLTPIESEINQEYTIKKGKNTNNPTTINEILPDTVYCIQTKKQNGWFAPLRSISQEHAKHLNMVYMFTNRNEAGRWTKMEVIDACGKYVTGCFSPYILNIGSADTDSLANQEWVERLKTACCYEFIADPSGEKILQERALDKDRNIIYIYSRTPIGLDSISGREQYIGTYKDCYGLLAEMRNDSNYTYGTSVMITADRFGNDSVVEFVDSKGIRKRNHNGAAKDCYVHDENGRIIKNQSRDENGNLTIDNYGNCGMEYECDKDDRIRRTTCMNDKWEPIPMPSNSRTEQSGSVGIIRCNYEYDKYGRQSEIYYTDENGVADVDSYGVHKITAEYDSLGNIVKQRSLDKENKLTDGQWCAIWQAKYDDKGRPIEITALNKDSLLLEEDGYWCKNVKKYNDKGEEILNEYYSVINGTLKLTYKYEKTNDNIYELRFDGTSNIDSLDNKGRSIVTIYYDNNGKLDSTRNWAKCITTYKDLPGKTIKTEQYYDSNNQLCDFSEVDNGAINITEIDSLKFTRTLYVKDFNGILKSCNIQNLSNDFNVTLGQSDVNEYGKICRAGGSSETRYYHADVLYSSKENKFTSLIGKDEFDEPDYIDADNYVYYYKRLSSNGYSIYYDENNNEIKDNVTFLNYYLPKVISIEVVDSVAYKLGLKDNDVVLLYGDYTANLDSIYSVGDFRAKWSFHSALNAHKERRMVVFRVNPETLEYGLVEIPELKGNDKELGFIAHTRYLTKKQLNRIKSAIDANVSSSTPFVAWSDFDKGNIYDGKNNIVVCFPNMFRCERQQPYPSQIGVPSILMATCMKEMGLEWNSEVNINELVNILSKHGNNGSKQYMFFSKDLQSIDDICVQNNVGVNLYLYSVNDSIFDIVMKQTKIAMKQMDNIKVKTTFDKKLLKGKWETFQVVDGGSMKMQMDIKKEKLGLMFEINLEGEVSQGIEMKANIAISLDTRYSLIGNVMNITYVKEPELINSVVEIIGPGLDKYEQEQIEELRTQFVEYFENGLKDMASNLLESESIYINDCNETTLVIDNGTELTRVN